MSRMTTFSIQSGSNGNCIYVETGDTRLLFDAGVSGRVLKDRMGQHGRCPHDVDALFITHEHIDHVRGAGVFHRLFGMPVYITPKTLYAARNTLGKVRQYHHFNSGESVTIKDVVVHSVPTPHDAVDSVGYIIEHDNRRLGIFTDLGHTFLGLSELLCEVDAAYLESNYDDDMLTHGPYADGLKRRIRGQGGHLSNREAADLMWRCAGNRHQWVALAHLSENNNTPELALATHRDTVGQTFPFVMTSRYDASASWEIA